MISSILGIVFFEEGTGILKFLGIGLILGAVFLVNFRNLHLEKNHLYALISGALFGVTYTIDKALVTSASPLAYLCWCFFFVAFFGMLQAPRQTIQSAKKLTKNEFALLSLSGFGYFVFNYLTFMTYTMGAEVGRVDAINNSQVFVVIAVEYFLFKQREGISRKIVAALIASIGVIILGIL